jgi:endonuclease/exonuclease/phosphatase family metal-dependent hydrolase
VKRGIHVEDRPDVRLDDHKSSKLRFASYLVLNPDSAQPIHLLAIHLKAGCSGAYKNRRSCKTLKAQTSVLRQWIADRESNQHAYIVLGDFNHNLAYSGDWMWRTLSKGNRAKLATETTPALCQVRSRNNPSKLHQFRSLIDHIVTSPNLAMKDVEQSVFAAEAVITHQLSDHCPISATLSL